MADLVQPLKFEHSSTGGTETDEVATAVDETEDYLSARGYALQRATRDESVVVDRDVSDNMTFKDVANPTPKTLTELLAGAGGLTEGSHNALRQLIHFVDNGPADGFASGAYRETIGGLFPTSIVWWESSSKLKKIVEKTIAGPAMTPSPITWVMYDTDGTTPLITLVDAIVYSGISETNRTRTWS